MKELFLILFEKLQLFPSVGIGIFKSNRYILISYSRQSKRFKVYSTVKKQLVLMCASSFLLCCSETLFLSSRTEDTLPPPVEIHQESSAPNVDLKILPPKSPIVLQPEVLDEGVFNEVPVSLIPEVLEEGVFDEVPVSMIPEVLDEGVFDEVPVSMIPEVLDEGVNEVPVSLIPEVLEEGVFDEVPVSMIPEVLDEGVFDEVPVSMIPEVLDEGVNEVPVSLIPEVLEEGVFDEVPVSMIPEVLDEGVFDEVPVSMIPEVLDEGVNEVPVSLIPEVLEEGGDEVPVSLIPEVLDSQAVEPALVVVPSEEIPVWDDSEGEWNRSVIFQPDTGLQPVFFRLNSYYLFKPARDILDKNIQWLKDHPHITHLELEGHCDFIGEESYNITLGRLRAESVKEYLKSNGIPEEKLTVISYGESRPLSSSDPDKNRRVSFVPSY